MSDSIGKIFWVAAEGEGSGFGVVYEHRHGDLKTRTERGARAVALHVLERAAPDSPILEAMRQGMSFEEAAERFDVKALETVPLERSFRSALELVAAGHPKAIEIAKGALKIRENLRRFADEHPTPEQESERRQEIKQASLDSAPDSGRDVDEGPEYIEGYPSPGVGFCRGLGSPPKGAV